MPLEQNLERICISTEFHLSLPVLESSMLLFHIFLAPLRNHFSVKLSSMGCNHQTYQRDEEKKKRLRQTLGTDRRIVWAPPLQSKTERPLVFTLHCRSPHATQVIIKLNHMSHTIQDKFSAILIQKGKLEHCIPMCAPSLITAPNDGFTKRAN